MYNIHPPVLVHYGWDVIRIYPSVGIVQISAVHYDQCRTISIAAYIYLLHVAVGLSRSFKVDTTPLTRPRH